MTGIGKSDDFVGLLCVCLENNLHIPRIYIQDHKIRSIDKKRSKLSAKNASFRPDSIEAVLFPVKINRFKHNDANYARLRDVSRAKLA